MPDCSYVCDSDGYCRCPGFRTIKVPFVKEFRVQNYDWRFNTLEEAQESVDNILNSMIKHIIPCDEKEAVRLFLMPDSVSPKMDSIQLF